jgi:hypothetical protein
MSHCPTLYLNSYHVKDTLGNIASTTAWEGDDEVYIAVKHIGSGGNEYNLIYTDEAKHLRDWCRDHNLQLRHQIIEVEIPNPFESEE